MLQFRIARKLLKRKGMEKENRWEGKKHYCFFWIQVYTSKVFRGPYPFNKISLFW
jgi:hypothetical protein